MGGVLTVVTGANRVSRTSSVQLKLGGPVKKGGILGGELVVPGSLLYDVLPHPLFLVLTGK